jgi:hypothetical protein
MEIPAQKEDTMTQTSATRQGSKQVADKNAARMKRIAFLVVAVAAVAGVVTSTLPASGQADGEAAPIYGVKLPPGYRDWSLISVAHMGGSVNDVRAKLGNDVAIKATGMRRSRSPTAQSLPGSPGVASRRRKTTKPFALFSNED